MPPLAAAVGPWRAPSLPISQPAAERAAAPPSLSAGSEPSMGNRTFVSAGDWTGRASRPGVHCGAPSAGPPGAGRCPSLCDQLYDTCPLPTDLPLGSVPPRGGPVGAEPLPKLPQALTHAEVAYALKGGLLKMPPAARLEADTGVAINGTTTYAASAARPAEHGHAGMEAASATAEELSINAGDSWVIRNSNCEIAPIHGVLNRVCTAL